MNMHLLIILINENYRQIQIAPNVVLRTDFLLLDHIFFYGHFFKFKDFLSTTKLYI